MAGFASVVLVTSSSALSFSCLLTHIFPRAEFVSHYPQFDSSSARGRADWSQIPCNHRRGCQHAGTQSDLGSSDCCHLPKLHGCAVALAMLLLTYPHPCANPKKVLGICGTGVTPGSAGSAQTRKCPTEASAPSSLSLTFTTPVMAFSFLSHSSLPASHLSFCDPSIRKQGGCLILQLACRLLQKLCTSFLLHARMQDDCRECSQSCSSDLLCWT